MFLHLNLDSDKFNSNWSNSKPFSFVSYGDEKAKIIVRKLEHYSNRMFGEIKIEKELIDNYYDVPKKVVLKKFVTREKVENAFDYYICGSKSFIEKYKNILKENNVNNVFYENWS